MNNTKKFRNDLLLCRLIYLKTRFSFIPFLKNIFFNTLLFNRSSIREVWKQIKNLEKFESSFDLSKCPAFATDFHKRTFTYFRLPRGKSYFSNQTRRLKSQDAKLRRNSAFSLPRALFFFAFIDKQRIDLSNIVASKVGKRQTCSCIQLKIRQEIG